MFNEWKKKSKGFKISKSLLWEYDLSNFDWHKMRLVVVSRVIERGWMSDFYAAIALYGGKENFKKIITEIPYLSDKDIDFVSKIFDIKKENLRCYTRKQSREKLLNS